MTQTEINSGNQFIVIKDRKQSNLKDNKNKEINETKNETKCRQGDQEAG